MRNRFTSSVVSLAILACLAAAGPDTATSSPVPDGPYDLSWFTIDGGGGMSAGGNFAFSGTAGQPDGGFHTAGNDDFEGGYWGNPPIPGGVPRVIVAEMFGATQDISYCPHARCALERLQGDLGTDRFLYWENHLWDDPYQIPEGADRADWYQVGTGVPHVRIDGKSSIVGAGDCDIAYETYRSVVYQHRSESLGMSSIEIFGATILDTAGNTLQADVTLCLVAPATLSDLRATILVYEDNVRDAQGTWPNVTRAIYDTEITLGNPGDQVEISHTFFTDPSWDPFELHVVAYVQTTTGNKEIYQALYVPDSDALVDITVPTASILRTRIDSARPNPFNPRTAIDFTLSASDANGAIRLEIFDLSGRRVARLLDGKIQPGAHTQVWDGRNDRDRAVQSGVYFGRLTTRDGTHSRKLILLK